MTFQAYIDNIQAKTGKSPADFQRMAETKGFVAGGTLKKGVKAGQNRRLADGGFRSRARSRHGDRRRAQGRERKP